MSVPHEISSQVHERDNYICVYCNLDGRLSYYNFKSLTIDHFRPKMFGDNHSIENLDLHSEKEIMENIRHFIAKERVRDFERYVEIVLPFLNSSKQ